MGGTASVMILVWPAISYVIFTIQRNVGIAILLSTILGYLVLPSAFAFNLPGLPPIDKDAATALSVAALLFLLGKRVEHLLPQGLLAKLLVVSFVLSPVLTVVTNMDPISEPAYSLPPLSLYDSLSLVFANLMMVIHFMAAYNFLSSERGNATVLIVLLACAACYSILALFELRFSPQLHAWVYGYYPRPFGMFMRWGGYRPVVFLQSGLWYAFFTFMSLIAAIALWRDRNRAPADSFLQPYYGYLSGYFAVLLFLCKALGSIIYGFVMAPLALLVGRRLQLMVAATLAAFALLYPISRGAHLVPTDTLTSLAETIDRGRASSLQFRFDNEDLLLEKAERRSLFGWGSWGRNRVYDEESGADISTTDGYWIIQIGIFGWVGFLSAFGLLGLPILRLWVSSTRMGPSFVTTGLALILAVNMIELLPNSTLTPMTWLIAGALLGFCDRGGASTETQAAPEPRAAAERLPVSRIRR